VSPELKFAIRAARDAGAIAMQHFNNVEVEFKADDSPVTIADREVERQLKANIAAVFPEDAFLGEETGHSNGESSRRWVIDPIDGTKSFVAGVPLFSTLIGLEVDNEPVIGVAHFPALDETYSAERGKGAFLNGNPIYVSSVSELSSALLVCGSLDSFRKAGRLERFLDLSERVYAVRTWGDAYGHCLVARGSAEIMLDPSVSVWDTCAVAVIVREAGGTFTNFRGVDGHAHGEAVSVNQHLAGLLFA